MPLVPYFSARDKCFKVGRIPLKGVRPLLEEWFFQTEARASAPTPRGGQWRGQDIGRQVDQEISSWAKCPKKFVASTAHAYTRNLIAAFRTWGWKPVTGQLCIGSLSFTVGTAIDLVFLNTDQQMIIVELKCGFDGYWQTPTGMMLAPLDDVPNSPLHQATVQLLFGELLMNLTTRHRPVHAWVVLANGLGVTRFNAHRVPFVRTLSDHLMHRLTGCKEAKIERMKATVAAKKKKRPVQAKASPPPAKRRKRKEIIVLDDDDE